MKIANIHKLTGNKITIYGYNMVFGAPASIDDYGFEVNLFDAIDTNVAVFGIVVNAKTNSILVADIQNKREELGTFTKKDIDTISNFEKTIGKFILKLPTIDSYLTLLKSIQDSKVSLASAKVNAGYYTTSHSTHSVSLPTSHSFSHLSGSLGQPINPNKKRFLSKATAKMPVTMSVNDDELW